jgi:diguanylate cyclase (GGDEF)-like protein
MISIKKYLDMAPKPAAKGAAVDSNPTVAALLQTYRATLDSIGNNGPRACPAVGSELQRALAGIQKRLTEALSGALLLEVGKQTEKELNSWGRSAAEYFKSKTGEIKELLMALARTAESMGTRDKRYSEQLVQFTRQLETIATLEDLGQVRTSLLRKAAELKVCIDEMAEDCRKAVTQLKSDVTVYETRVREAEVLASKDELTGLPNRRSLENRIDVGIASGRPFCVVMLDLDGFKQVNDMHGHAAGDLLLKQFAAELRTNIRASDTSGRWGGDEFVLLLDSDLASAQGQIERIEKWAFGEYTLPAGEGRGPLKLEVRASIGVAEWPPGKTPAELIERADKAMYSQKKVARKQNA